MGREGFSALGIGVIVASFQFCGISPVAKDRLKRSAREGASSVAASLSRRVGMLSDPALLRVSSVLSNFSTSCGEVVMLSSDDVMFVVVVMDGVSSGSRLTDC